MRTFISDVLIGMVTSLYPEQRVLRLTVATRFTTIHNYIDMGNMILRKGSVSAMLSAVYRNVGYKTGLFISPFIINFRERIQINGEYISESDFGHLIDIVTCDLSFISVKYIFQSTFDILKDGGEFVCLIKPQFEAGKENIGKNGIVRSNAVHEAVIKNVIDYAENKGFFVKGVCPSSIVGGDGNIEYLVWLENSATEVSFLNGINLRNFVDDVFEQYK